MSRKKASTFDTFGYKAYSQRLVFRQHLITQGSRHRFENSGKIPLRVHRRARQQLLCRAAEGAASPDRPALARKHQKVPQPADVLKPNKEKLVLLFYSEGVVTLEGSSRGRYNVFFVVRRGLRGDDAKRS